MKLNIFLFFILVCICNNSLSQTSFSKPKYQIETGTYLSTNNNIPFFLHTNQYGTVPINSPIISLKGIIRKEYDSTKKVRNHLPKFSYGYGINAVVNAGKTNQILLSEAYLKVRLGIFELYGGRRHEIFGLVDTTLSSGSYIWSGNALPIPKVQISIPNYSSIIRGGLLAIKGGYAHGWFDNGVVKNSFLHQKWLYARLGKPNWKIKLYGGFNHQVQWGGTPKNSYIEPNTGKLITNFGNDFKTYLNVVTGISLNANGEGLDLNGVPLNEAWNRAGNHLGTIDIAGEITGKKIDLFIYRQSIYEDGSLFYLSNINDGLLGIAIKRKNIQRGLLKVCLEYLNTTSQGGNTGSHNTIPQLRGQDNYFNNGIYKNGWTYAGNVIGTPIIIPQSQINKNLISNYNFSAYPNSFIVNSRVQAYYLSLMGILLKTHFTTKILWSKNYGIYEYPIIANQFSFSQHFSYNLPKYTLFSNIAIDTGQLYKQNIGCYLGVRRTFF